MRYPNPTPFGSIFTYLNGSLKDISAAANFKNSSMIGVGVAPEGINQNYAIYEFALERGWDYRFVNITEWFDTYSLCRYGNSDSFVSLAWQQLVVSCVTSLMASLFHIVFILQKSVYSFRGTREISGKYIVCRQPSLKHVVWV